MLAHKCVRIKICCFAVILFIKDFWGYKSPSSFAELRLLPLFRDADFESAGMKYVTERQPSLSLL